jgi:acyl-coenzyme A thioesterase PaaI-like protein
MGREAKVDRTGSARVKQPNSRFCFACGVENSHGLKLAFYETAPNEVEAKYTIPDHFQGYPGVAHGGIVATMMDETLGRATMLGESVRFMVTATLKVSYRHPVPTGQPIRVVGRVTRRRGRVAKAEGELRLSDGTLAVQAEATLVDSPEAAPTGEQLEALGWRVWPD